MIRRISTDVTRVECQHALCCHGKRPRVAALIDKCRRCRSRTLAFHNVGVINQFPVTQRTLFCRRSCSISASAFATQAPHKKLPKMSPRPAHEP